MASRSGRRHARFFAAPLPSLSSSSEAKDLEGRGLLKNDSAWRLSLRINRTVLTFVTILQIPLTKISIWSIMLNREICLLKGDMI